MYTTVIELEGTDKVGKSTLHKYLGKLGHYNYIINDRGILTQLVYRDKFSRNVGYTLSYKPLVVLLSVDEEDFEVRCTINNEPIINFRKDAASFEDYAKYLESLGVRVLRYNTSKITAYQIAKDIIKTMEIIGQNTDANILTKPVVLENLNLYRPEDLEGEDIFYE